MSEASLIVPCLNEADFIEDCLESLVDETNPGMEILVVDGGSTDGTREIVTALSHRIPGIRLLDNPKRTAAAAMNVGLRACNSDIVFRIDAHCRFPPGYVAQLRQALDTHEADVVGADLHTVARDGTAIGLALAGVLSHPLGVGNSHFRTGTGEVREVDTVPFGCWRRSTLDLVGEFSEDLTRSQDFDMARRLQAVGAKVLLIPGLSVTYFARSDFFGTFRYNIGNGYWVTFPALAHGVRFGLRHYAPLAAAALGFLLAAAAVVGVWQPLALAVALYAVVCAKVTWDLRPKGGQPAAMCLTVPLALASLHLAYGLGSVKGIVPGLVARRGRDRLRSR